MKKQTHLFEEEKIIEEAPKCNTSVDAVDFSYFMELLSSFVSYKRKRGVLLEPRIMSLCVDILEKAHKEKIFDMALLGKTKSLIRDFVSDPMETVWLYSGEQGVLIDLLCNEKEDISVLELQKMIDRSYSDIFLEKGGRFNYG